MSTSAPASVAAAAVRTMSWANWLYSPSGRINRTKFWLGIAIHWGIWLATSLFGMFVAYEQVHSGGLVSWILLLPILASLWGILALLLKRIRDREKTAWMVVPMVLIPAILGVFLRRTELDGPVAIVLGLAGFGLWLWGFVEIGFLEGTEGENEFGLDPVGVRLG